MLNSVKPDHRGIIPALARYGKPVRGLDRYGECTANTAMSLDPRLSAFVNRFYAVARSRAIAPATLSTKIFLDGKRFAEIASGSSDIGIGRLARAEHDLEALAADGGQLQSK